MLAELVGMALLLWIMANQGIGNGTLLCWLVLVLLMLCSKALQIWWRMQASARRRSA